MAMWELWPPGEKPTDWSPGVLDLHWEGGMPRSRGSVNRYIRVQEEEGTLREEAMKNSIQLGGRTVSSEVLGQRKLSAPLTCPTGYLCSSDPPELT